MSNLYLLLFAGGINPYANYPRYGNDLKRAANAMAKLVGYASSRTRILSGPGGQGVSVGSDTLNTMPGTRDQLASTISEFSELVTLQDRFLFLSSNHGGRTEDAAKSTLWCWQKTEIVDEEFSSWCGAIQSQFQVFVLGQCYSGGFIRPLSARSRVVMAASAWNEPSYATADSNFDEFILRTIEAIEARTTTWKAVFDYAKVADTRRETPQYSDVGNRGDDPSP